jgi:hypothetical protein
MCVCVCVEEGRECCFDDVSEYIDDIRFKKVCDFESVDCV